MAQGLSIRYFRTRHVRDLQLPADAGVGLLGTWTNEGAHTIFNRQGYDAQGHTLQQQGNYKG